MSNEEKRMNPFFRILFAIILPFLVALILAVIVLSILGINVLGWTETQLTKAPIISSFVKTEDEKSLTEKLEKANGTIDTQKDEIANLLSEIEQLEAQIDNMDIEIAKLE